MIESIEVLIRNGIHITMNALILYPKRTAYINDKKYQITDSYLEELEEIIYLWKNEYGSSNTIDAEEFLVTVTTNKGKETFHGKGIFPHNYEALKELLSDQYD